VDVFQFDHTHELYAHMNINYIKLGRLPAFDRWGDALAPWQQEFFTTTGEVLLRDVTCLIVRERGRGKGSRAMDVPLRFAEIVWGRRVRRRIARSSSWRTRASRQQTFDGEPRRTAGSGADVVWDVAGNGAFVNLLAT